MLGFYVKCSICDRDDFFFVGKIIYIVCICILYFYNCYYYNIELFYLIKIIIFNEFFKFF